MFKRMLWLAIGTGVGFGTSFWVTRAVRQRVRHVTGKFAPERVVGAVSSLRRDIRDAVADGRLAMREREAELRELISSPPPDLTEPAWLTPRR
ncbi:MAG: hypothetical protein ACRD1K_11165 [Acidimicrobiales bacterium]